MVKIIALYGHPNNPSAFEEYYANDHLPLVETIPNARRLETARVSAVPPRASGVSSVPGG